MYQGALEMYLKSAREAVQNDEHHPKEKPRLASPGVLSSLYLLRNVRVDIFTSFVHQSRYRTRFSHLLQLFLFLSILSGALLARIILIRIC